MALLNVSSARLIQRIPRQYVMRATSTQTQPTKVFDDNVPFLRIDFAPGREEIGFGIKGEKDYYDRVDYPTPAVRYKEDTPQILALREKEKGDWKSLTKDEKKALYRTSFRLTYAEIEAPTGAWKYYTGWFFFWYTLALWGAIGFYKLRNRNGLRPSLSLEARQAQLQRLIAMKVGIENKGLSSKWDYEKEEWKS